MSNAIQNQGQEIERVYDAEGDDVLNTNDTCTEGEIFEAVQGFLLGDLTLAQLEGISAEEMYAVASLGHDLLEEGKVEEARKIFEGLNVYNPMDSYFHAILGSIYERQDRFEDAARHYKSAVELYPEDVNSWTGLGETLLRWCGALHAAGEVEKAAEAFEGAVEALSKAIQTAPQDDDGAALRARALVSAAAAIYEARKAS